MTGCLNTSSPEARCRATGFLLLHQGSVLREPVAREWQPLLQDVRGLAQEARPQLQTGGSDSGRDVWQVAKTKWYVYWRLFFLSCAEMFNYNSGTGKGNEWYISHYLFTKPDGK